MKLFLKVPIVCAAGRGDVIDYEALGIKRQDNSQALEAREGAIKIDKITSWYPSADFTGTVVELGTEVYVLDLTTLIFESLLEEYIINPNQEKLI